VHAGMHVRICKHMHVHECVCVCVCPCACTCVCLCSHACACACAHFGDARHILVTLDTSPPSLRRCFPSDNCYYQDNAWVRACVRAPASAGASWCTGACGGGIARFGHGCVLCVLCVWCRQWCRKTSRGALMRRRLQPLRYPQGPGLRLTTPGSRPSSAPGSRCVCTCALLCVRVCVCAKLRCCNWLCPEVAHSTHHMLSRSPSGTFADHPLEHLQLTLWNICSLPSEPFAAHPLNHLQLVQLETVCDAAGALGVWVLCVLGS